MRALLAVLAVAGLAWTPAHHHARHHRAQPTVQCIIPVPGQFTPDLCLFVPPRHGD